MITVTHHDGAGNDFLVAMADDRLGPSAARTWCDRVHGIGADGLLAVGVGTTTDLTMRLWNADGSLAEMSGNGIRCLVHGAVLAGLVAPGTISVATDAGVRTVEFSAAGDGEGWASVAMGAVTLGEDVVLAGGGSAQRASVGNPHLVCLCDSVEDLDPMIDGPALSAAPEGGTNVEWISVRADGGLDFVVYERGVGPTKACGTGSCAAAAVAHAHGLVGPTVAVHNPGGVLSVDVADVDAVVLSGPVRYLGTATVAFPDEGAA